jgi:GDPmannose 4,6-dehydratase
LDVDLVLGNLESRRDWGRAQDYVQAMWLMLQHKSADDYIVATGETHSVREFVEAAFAIVDLPSEKYVKRDPAFDRPTEPARLVGSADKIRQMLGWQSTGTFPQLVREMVEAELAAIEVKSGK